MFVKYLRVVKVEQRFMEVVNHVDRSMVPMVVDKTSISTGWWISFNDYTAICVGPDKPDIEVGDTILATWRKAREQRVTSEATPTTL